MERQKITHSWLLEHGYKIDETIQNMFDEVYPDSNIFIEERRWCTEPIRFYKNDDGRITIQHRWTNRYGEGYNVHIDNQVYESVGCLEVLYVDELEKFIEVSYDESCSN